ncbi:MAG: RecX family transcriptional regulator [Chitinophagaceae bacterium]|nr:MAG: RecX family transcriptional regulator [Chitinophagaceae bacterium]
MEKLNIGVEAARKKIQHYCAYQERCHSEVKDRLYEMGLRTSEINDLISELIGENFLNEERFAIAFAGGKFRMKQWGRVKIKYELKKRNVSEYCIRKALQAIDNVDYSAILELLARKKSATLKGNHFQKRAALTRYLLQKGFESDLVGAAVKAVLEKN